MQGCLSILSPATLHDHATVEYISNALDTETDHTALQDEAVWRRSGLSDRSY
jgi:hypothetical protein